MSAFGTPQNVRIGTELVLDLDRFRAELKKGVRDANKEGETIGSKIGEGLKKAAAAAFLAQLSVEKLKMAYQKVGESIERIAARQGADNPAVKAFRGINNAVRDLFDTFVRGVLSSASAQEALAALTDSARGLATNMGNVTTAIDDFVLGSAPALIEVGATIAATFSLMGDTFKTMRASYALLLSGVLEVGSAVRQFSADFLKATASLMQGPRAGILRLRFQEWAADLESTTEAAGELAKGLRDEGLGMFNQIAADLETTYGAAAAKLVAFFDRVKVAPAGEDADPTNLLGLDDDEGVALKGALSELGSMVSDAFVGAFASASKALHRFAELAADRGEDIRSAWFGGTADALAGVAALGSQVTRSLGASSRAAKVWARVQLGIQATLATVSGLESLGKFWDNKSENPVAAAGHLIASGAFFSAAALAGAQGAGALGGSGSASSGATTPPSIADDLADRKVEVKIVVEGNLVGDDNFVRNTVIPTIRNVLEEADVVLTDTPTGEV